MTSETTGRTQKSDWMFWAFFVFSIANLAVRRWKPGSTAAIVVEHMFTAFTMLWLALKIAMGYLRRRPYWNRDSWLRYLRLALLPVLAVTFVLVMSTEWGMSLTRGASGATRVVLATVLVTSLMLGAVGLAVVL